VWIDTDDEEGTRLSRPDLRMLSEHGGFMLDRVGDKGEKLAGTPQAAWARRIHASTALATRRRVVRTA
jgi:hypothetical protein